MITLKCSHILTDLFTVWTGSEVASGRFPGVPTWTGLLQAVWDHPGGSPNWLSDQKTTVSDFGELLLFRIGNTDLLDIPVVNECCFIEEEKEKKDWFL